MAGSEAPASVLDASALLAHLNEERGAAFVREAMQAGAAISVINWIEVLTKLGERGEDPELAAAELRAAGLIGATVSVEPVTDADCIAVARLRSTTKDRGLPLADRACLILATRLGVPAITADRAWGGIEGDIKIQLIR